MKMVRECSMPAKTARAVISREGGVSSTPRPIGLITGASGILDRPAFADDDIRPRSRDADRPRSASALPLSKIGERRKDRGGAGAAGRLHVTFSSFAGD